MVKWIRGCCLQTQIDLELEEKEQVWNENAPFTQKKGQWIDFYHLNADGACKKKFDICLATLDVCIEGV